MGAEGRVCCASDDAAKMCDHCRVALKEARPTPPTATPASKEVRTTGSDWIAVIRDVPPPPRLADRIVGRAAAGTAAPERTTENEALRRYLRSRIAEPTGGAK
jgi:hypothetical protein